MEGKDEDETMGVYDPAEDDYVLCPRAKPKDNTRDISKTKTFTKDKHKTKTDDNIYTRIKYECEECHEEFRNKIALTHIVIIACI